MVGDIASHEESMGRRSSGLELEIEEELLL
jgi:hypothetical protein